jgi:hypothetical protein
MSANQRAQLRREQAQPKLAQLLDWLSQTLQSSAANIQSLLYTAKLNSLDPAAWLKDTLDKLPTCLNSNIDELLPLRSNSPFSS